MRPEELNIPKEKFVLVNENKKLKDKELVTKPVGFFMDAMHRFAKNKGSIVGAIVIAILILYALVIPLFSQYDVAYHDTYYRFTLPKLFNSEKIDFLDGCKNKTVNETTFLYYYSMGVETGHNAVKRQSYTTKDGMYSYREDSYQKAGTVYKTGVSAKDYAAIQKYQDEHNVQIIYPITDLDKRPEATQNLTDANYWFETKMQGSISVPTNYTFNADGTVTFTNIYTPYSVGALSSSSSFTSACQLNLVSKDSGYAICFKKSVLNEAGVAEESLEYLSCYYFNGEEVAICVNNLESASVFEFDTTYNVLKTNITGHEDASQDGYYFLGLPVDSGTTASLQKESELAATNYVPFSLFSSEDTLVTSPSVNEKYYLGCTKKTTSEKLFYFSDVSSGHANAVDKANGAKKIKLEDNGSGAYFINLGDRKIARYINVVANGNNNTFTETRNASEASSWQYDSSFNGLKVNVTGHTDASYDGDYILTLKLTDDGNFSIVLALASEISGDDTLFPLRLFSNNNTEATTVAAGEYYLANRQVANVFTKYFADGDFVGDNYTSKMRIEGEDNYLYSYARPTNGTYELRVNYFEYYKYYHKAVLKDRITQPYFLFGTTSSGQDIFTCLASGARFSFILAIIVASVNLFVGAIYGAIEGYYGGRIDLVMERIVEILSAVPFMIVITLLKYHMGGTSHAVILFISFFLTGWIGMSGLVRMQFYRFKNQEYVLASRTLGARDLRIMFKHIFPNALGTIVTSCVLVIPGMIFSETSLSYLGIINLNSGSMTSVGTLLANAQPYLVSYPHMILFPAIFISLLMLCFNLFGNGLRDAFNPSLRGTED